MGRYSPRSREADQKAARHSMEASSIRELEKRLRAAARSSSFVDYLFEHNKRNGDIDRQSALTARLYKDANNAGARRRRMVNFGYSDAECEAGAEQ